MTAHAPWAVQTDLAAAERVWRAFFRKNDGKDNSPSLPPAVLARWSPRRKMAVVEAVRAGGLSRDEAVKRYGLSLAEISSWERLYRGYGLAGLKNQGLKASRRHAAFGSHPPLFDDNII